MLKNIIIKNIIRFNILICLKLYLGHAYTKSHLFRVKFPLYLVDFNYRNIAMR